MALVFKRVDLILTLMVWIVLSATTASGQTTIFTYQGKLIESGVPANGSYECEFTLFDALTGGRQIGPVNTREEVMVVNGIFTVQLDFGAPALNGGDRFLEISVRPSDGPGGGLLTPRQQLTSTPFAIKSLNASSADGLSASCVSCVNSGQIASVAGSAVSGQIPVAGVPGGSGNYIQNATSQQAASNFNISGDGTAGGTITANAVTSATQFNIGSVRVFGIAGNGNVFAGANSGTLNTGINNSFFGAAAGAGNTTGDNNAFFGTQSGATNILGNNNAFFGYRAGFQNTADENSFFGSFAGQSNTTSRGNAFFGYQAGAVNSGDSFIGGNFNSFFGAFAGSSNTTGPENSFFGHRAGSHNSTGKNNTFIGSGAGIENSTGVNNTFVGVSAGFQNEGNENTFIGLNAGGLNTEGRNNTLIGTRANVGSTNLSYATAIGRMRKSTAATRLS
jgi:hypothetical protein